MWFIRQVLVALMTTRVVVTAQTQQQQQQQQEEDEKAPNMTMTDLFTLTPKCAAGCSMSSVEELADCLCTNTTLMLNITTCVQQSCDYPQVIEGARIQARLCANYPKSDRGKEMRDAAAAGIALTTFFIIARCAARITTNGKIMLDDYLAIGATANYIIFASLQIASTVMGFGLHIWDVHDDMANKLIKIFYICQLFYVLIQALAKISILALYKTIFVDRTFRIVLNFFIGLMVLIFFIFFGVVGFQCLPVRAIWDLNLLLEKKCLNVNAVSYAGAIVVIVQDLILIVLPIPGVLKLNMNNRQRVFVCFLLAVYSFATVTSMIRLRFLVYFSSPYDTSWDNIDSAMWSTIECSSAIICGCLPALRHWGKPYFPKIKKAIDCIRGRGRKSAVAVGISPPPEVIQEEPGQKSEEVRRNASGKKKNVSLYQISAIVSVDRESVVCHDDDHGMRKMESSSSSTQPSLSCPRGSEMSEKQVFRRMASVASNESQVDLVTREGDARSLSMTGALCPESADVDEKGDKLSSAV